MKEYTYHLPKTVGAWTRPDSAHIVDSSNIFQYMNGAGELYLGYRFDHLDAFEYTAEDQTDILVEIYVMDTSDDAFGLLSLDWGGDPVTFSEPSGSETGHPIAPSSKALYGGGLLRMWSDTIYARVMAYQETPASKDAVLALGRAIAVDRKNPSEPELLQVLPQKIGSDWTLRRDRIGYFRSYLVLNSLYYLSHQNILDLDHSTEVVTAPYEKTLDTEERTRVQLVFAKYANPEHARQALEHFHSAYLPEHTEGVAADSTIANSNVFNIEDGWVGYRLDGASLALVFECPDRESTRMLLNHIQF
ncbi:MAG: hypothetical protein GY801_21005 [bacterium]|nr:hypothetical protein [bacterium]